MSKTGSGSTEKPSDRRKLVAVVYADMVGYSRLISLDDQGTLERLRALRRNLIDPAIEEHGGSVVQTGGDSLLIVFDSIDGAVRCAVKVQQQVPIHDHDQPPDRAIRFRVGINLGDAIADGTDLHGDAVNVAARLQAECPPGGICVTRPIRDHVQDRLNLAFEELGPLSLKNIARPVEVFVLRPDDSAMLTGKSVDDSREQGITGAVGLSDRTSIIVLPFENLTDEGGEEISLADGITEDLTTDLARIPGVYVVARSRAFSYKGRAIDVAAIGRHLSVRFAIQGSVRRVGARIRVNAQLIDVRAGGYLWVDRFDTDPAGTTDAQNEITGRLIRALRRALVAEEERHIGNKHLNELNPSELVLRGKATATWPISRETYQAARDCYERALDLDSKLFDAQVGLAGTLLANVADGWSSSPEKDCVRAEQLIAEATSQDSNRAAARLVRGFLRRLQNRLAESQIDLEDAISLEPENPTAHSQLGYTLICLGQPNAAIAEIEQGMRLGPQEPLIPVCYFMLGLCYLLLRDTDRSIELFRRACAANTRLYYVYLGLAAAFGLKEDLDDARAALSEAIRLRPDIESLGRFRATHPWTTHPRHMELAEETLFLGLLRAGMSN